MVGIVPRLWWSGAMKHSPASPNFRRLPKKREAPNERSNVDYDSTNCPYRLWVCCVPDCPCGAGHGEGRQATPPLGKNLFLDDGLCGRNCACPGLLPAYPLSGI